MVQSHYRRVDVKVQIALDIVYRHYGPQPSFARRRIYIVFVRGGVSRKAQHESRPFQSGKIEAVGRDIYYLLQIYASVDRQEQFLVDESQKLDEHVELNVA